MAYLRNFIAYVEQKKVYCELSRYCKVHEFRLALVRHFYGLLNVLWRTCV